MSVGMLHVHNILRWVVLIAGLIAVVRAVAASSTAKPYSKMPGLIFLGSLHLQVILGLILYFGISGITQAFLSDPGASMKNPMLRFYGVEHLVGMLVAAIVATIGSARTRRAADDAKKNKTAAIFFGIALLLILASIPWPFRGEGVGRGLFPGGSNIGTPPPMPSEAPPLPVG